MSDAVLRASVRLASVVPIDADTRTTLADCRIAIAAARGRDLDDVDPALGYDLSDEAYRTVRDGWAERIAAGPLGTYLRERCARARAYWAARRPDLVADWPGEIA